MRPLAELLAHPVVARLARAMAAHPGRVVTPSHEVRCAAAAATFRLGDAGPELLLIRRAQQAGDPWSGHVAWPGGHKEVEDADLAVTAVRETREETGLDLARHGRLLGTLDDLRPRTPVLPPILVRPFVAAVGDDSTVKLNVEVAAHVWVPFDALLDERNWMTAPVATRVLAREERPVFRFQDFQVWGLTEYMLRQLVTRYRQTG